MDAPTPFLKIASADQAAGERFVGVIVDQHADGRTTAYGVFLLDDQVDDLSHKNASAWAQARGGEVPSMREMHLIAANAAERLDHVHWYWTRDGFQGGTRSFHNFDSKDGRVGYTHAWHLHSALVVRRVQIC